MSAEPARRPEDEDEATTAPESTGPAESLTPEAAADAEAAAAAASSEAATDSDPAVAEAAVAAADAEAAPTTAQAVATVDAANEAGSAEAAQQGSRRRAAAGAMRQLLVLVIGVALLIGGVAIGNYIFQTSRTAPTGSGFSPGVENEPPAVAREFIAALAANDLDAVRSSLDPTPHLDLTDELDRFGVQRIDNVETLGTSVDDTRAATEILVQYENETGAQSAINLVILTDGGKIEGFR